MTNIDLTEIMAMIAAKQYGALSEALYEMNEVDIAELIEQLPKNDALIAFRILKKDQAADVFAELDTDTQQNIISSVSNAEVGDLVDDLYIDDAVDMLCEMPAGVVKKVLKNASSDTRVTINRFLNYSPSSAGSIMTAEFAELKKDFTARQAISYLRGNGLDKETVYICYVTDSRRVLQGVVSFRELLFAGENQRVESLMNEDVISVKTSDDREEVANKISHYGFLALPVVDAENRLVGIVTVDDAIDVIERETTEDFHKMAAMVPSEKPYLDTGVFVFAKNRFLWLLVLMLSSTLTGMVLNGHQTLIAAAPLLVSFLPMLMGTAGNAGAQSSTVIIRSLATGDLKTSDWLRVSLKEGLVALTCGGVLAVINTVRVIIYPGDVRLAISISLSLLAAIVIAKVTGVLLPMGAKAVGLDPAVMAAPILTTIVDVAATLIFFGVSAALLAL